MSSITTWMRLEPGCRNPDMNTGLQAQVYDPLWYLARQWQLGEFQGEDHGSPASAHLEIEAGRLTRFQPGPVKSNTIVAGRPYDCRTTPLEPMVERESVRPAGQSSNQKLQLAVDAGLHFLRILETQPVSQSYRDDFIKQFGFQGSADSLNQLDADSISFIQLMSGRVPDGRLLYASLTIDGTGSIKIPKGLNVAPGDTAEVEQALHQWKTWYESLFSEPQTGDSCWVSERMEYSFSVGTHLSDGETSLTADEYFDGDLDWHDFDLNQNISLGAGKDDAISTITQTTIPAPVTFRGSPAIRFWEFEDARVNFGAVSAGPEDLGRMLLVEFAVSYGNDWFVIPVQLPVGSVCRTTSLVISNTFGEKFVIPSTRDAGDIYSTWRMFNLAMLEQPNEARAISELFFVPPVLMQNIESRPMEEVLFLRDEMANVAWGVERSIESPIEQPLSRYRPQPVPAAAAQDATPVYKLATPVPDNWIPFMPVASSAGLKLQRGRVLKLDGTNEFVVAEGLILNPTTTTANGFSIFEEEIPREGIRITRTCQYARWQDGSSHLWIGRRKRIGRGEGSSGLRFDTLIQ